MISSKHKMVSFQELILIFVFLLFSAFSLFVGFYSYGKLNEKDLKKIVTTIYNIEEHSGYRKAWISFSSAEGKLFYYRTDELNQGRDTSLVEIIKKKCEGKKVTIFYTERKDLMPGSLIEFGKYNRLVCLSCNDIEFLRLEEYNAANQNFYIGCLIMFIIGVLITTFFVIVRIGFPRSIRGKRSVPAKRK